MKRILFAIILIASLFIIKNLISSIYSLWQKQDLIISSQKEIEKEKKKNQILREKLSQALSKEFIEEQARNKLFLVKEGEQEILLSKNLLDFGEKIKEKPQNLPNWRKWWELFF